LLVALHQYLVVQVALDYLDYQRRQAFLGLLEVPVALQLLWWECPEGIDAHEAEAVVVDLVAYWADLEET